MEADANVRSNAGEGHADNNEIAPRVARGLQAAGFTIGDATIADAAAIVGSTSVFRWRWMASRLHVFVIVFPEPPGADRYRDLADAAVRYAVSHKPGLPRGLQTGVLAVPVFTAPEASADDAAWFARPPKRRLAVLEMPMLLLADGREALRSGGGKVWGVVFRGYLHDLAERISCFARTETAHD